MRMAPKERVISSSIMILPQRENMDDAVAWTDNDSFENFRNFLHGALLACEFVHAKLVHDSIEFFLSWHAARAMTADLDCRFIQALLIVSSLFSCRRSCCSVLVVRHTSMCFWNRSAFQWIPHCSRLLLETIVG